MIQHLEGDCRHALATLPAQSAHCCVTSPPYWQLRSYLPADSPHKHLEIGQEPTPEAYVQNLIAVFRLVWRVLCDRGTVWLNLGDTYASGGRKTRDPGKSTMHRAFARGAPRPSLPPGLKPKDLVGIPWRVALALQADGWFLRSEIIWNKPNIMPDPVRDRPTRSHEYLFLLTKDERYYYDADAIREPVTSSGGACFGKQRHDATGTRAQSRRLKSAADRNHPLGRNKRSVWTVPTRSFHGAHFAVFPPDLIRPCILAGCPKAGTVLDPFSGSGTTGVVAEELGRDAVLIELNPVYVTMQQQRLAAQGLLGSSRTLSPPPAGSLAAKQRLLWDDL